MNPSDSTSPIIRSPAYTLLALGKVPATKYISAQNRVITALKDEPLFLDDHVVEAVLEMDDDASHAAMREIVDVVGGATTPAALLAVFEQQRLAIYGSPAAHGDSERALAAREWFLVYAVIQRAMTLDALVLIKDRENTRIATQLRQKPFAQFPTLIAAMRAGRSPLPLTPELRDRSDLREAAARRARLYPDIAAFRERRAALERARVAPMDRDDDD